MSSFRCPCCGHEWTTPDWVAPAVQYCPRCEADLAEDKPRRRKLTRQERLEALADSGCDTWEDYRGER